MYPTGTIVAAIMADREREAASPRQARPTGGRKRFARRRRRRLRLALRATTAADGR